MSHSIHYGTYNENVNKKSVQADWDHYAAMEDWQEGCSGLPGEIRWINHVCDDYDIHVFFGVMPIVISELPEV